MKLRDFVLVKLCQDLLCFSPVKLMQGFSQEMVTEAQQKLKINKVLNQYSCSWTCSYQTSTIQFKLRDGDMEFTHWLILTAVKDVSGVT